jgi:hypothetical protein
VSSPRRHFARGDDAARESRQTKVGGVAAIENVGQRPSPPANPPLG